MFCGIKCLLHRQNMSVEPWLYSTDRTCFSFEESRLYSITYHGIWHGIKTLFYNKNPVFYQQILVVCQKSSNAVKRSPYFVKNIKEKYVGPYIQSNTYVVYQKSSVFYRSNCMVSQKSSRFDSIKQVLSSVKRAVYIHKSARLSEEPYILSKEPYILSNELHILFYQTKSCHLSKELNIPTKAPFCQKSPIFCQKSPLIYQKSSAHP